jgi:MFS transporter, PAT family, solute carrier family 33 (acetyl-CoA transportor), member 1
MPEFLIILLTFSVIYLGGKLFYTFSLWLVDVLTWKTCVYDSTSLNSTRLFIDNDCSDENLVSQCTEDGGKCEITVDGFYIEAVINTCFGILWYLYTRRYAVKLQELPLEAWHVNPVTRNEDLSLENRQELLK